MIAKETHKHGETEMWRLQTDRQTDRKTDRQMAHTQSRKSRERERNLWKAFTICELS